jgi:hypothetical protein
MSYLLQDIEEYLDIDQCYIKNDDLSILTGSNEGKHSCVIILYRGEEFCHQIEGDITDTLLEDNHFIVGDSKGNVYQFEGWRLKNQLQIANPVKNLKLFGDNHLLVNNQVV